MYSEYPSLRRLKCTVVETGQRRLAPPSPCLIPYFLHPWSHHADDLLFHGFWDKRSGHIVRDTSFRDTSTMGRIILGTHDPQNFVRDTSVEDTSSWQHAQESRLSLLPPKSKCRLDPDTGDWRPGFCQGCWGGGKGFLLPKGEETVYSPNQRY